MLDIHGTAKWHGCLHGMGMGIGTLIGISILPELAWLEPATTTTITLKLSQVHALHFEAEVVVRLTCAENDDAGNQSHTCMSQAM